MPEKILVVPPLRLLRTPRPRPGESFPGYLLRLTEQNSDDSVCWITARAGLKAGPSLGPWSHLWRPLPELSRLCEMTGLGETELESLREQLMPDCLVRWKIPKVCPLCLEEGSWCRKAWEVLPFTACPSHRVVLIDRCEHCQRHLTWARKSVSVCVCGYDWRRLRPPVIEDDRELTALQWVMKSWPARCSGSCSSP